MFNFQACQKSFLFFLKNNIIKKNALLVSFILSVFFISFFLFLPATPSLSQNLQFQKLKAHIKVHRFSFDINEPIIVEFQISNQGYYPVPIKLSDHPNYNFSFSVKSIKNQIVPKKNPLNNPLNLQEFQNLQNHTPPKSNQNTYNITLKPKQFYGQIFNLSQHFKFDKPGIFIIQGFFYPITTKIYLSPPIQSQIIQVQIRKTHSLEKQIIQQNIDKKQNLKIINNPYETLNFVLQSRIQKKWNQYFQYIDLLKLMKQFPKFQSDYSNLNPDQYFNLIQNFKEYLKNYLSQIGFGIINGFTIYKSIIENDQKKARIFAKIQYQLDNSFFYRKYIFYLYQKKEYWYIYSWKVENI